MATPSVRLRDAEGGRHNTSLERDAVAASSPAVARVATVVGAGEEAEPLSLDVPVPGDVPERGRRRVRTESVRDKGRRKETWRAAPLPVVGFERALRGRPGGRKGVAPSKHVRKDGNGVAAGEEEAGAMRVDGEANWCGDDRQSDAPPLCHDVCVEPEHRVAVFLDAEWVRGRGRTGNKPARRRRYRSWEELHPYVSMHVRWGDKCWKEATCRGARDYAKAAESLRRQFGVSRLALSSEDPEAISLIPEALGDDCGLSGLQRMRANGSARPSRQTCPPLTRGRLRRTSRRTASRRAACGGLGSPRGCRRSRPAS